MRSLLSPIYRLSDFGRRQFGGSLVGCTQAVLWPCDDSREAHLPNYSHSGKLICPKFLLSVLLRRRLLWTLWWRLMVSHTSAAQLRTGSLGREPPPWLMSCCPTLSWHPTMLFGRQSSTCMHSQESRVCTFHVMDERWWAWKSWAVYRFGWKWCMALVWLCSCVQF